MQRNDLSLDDVEAIIPGAFADLTKEEKLTLQARVRYDGYIRRERERIERLGPLLSRRIPPSFEYRAVPGLSHEVVETCTRRQPRTIGEAARIPGVTPAAVAILCAHVARGGEAAPGPGIREASPL